MRKCFALFIFALTYPVFCVGQGVSDSITPIGLTTIAEVNQGNSYITFPIDVGNIEPLWFEANLIPNFYIRESKSSRLIGVLTPQIIIRMYREKSFPVRTPSYMPQITVYYHLTGNENVEKLRLFGRLGHHSNGQDGDFYLENGEVNLKSGNFSTNYFEVGIIKTNFVNYLNAHQFFKTSIEVHPESWSDKELKGKYSVIRWHNTFSVFKLPVLDNQSSKGKTRISFNAEATWLFGEVNNWNGWYLNRLNLMFTFFYHPQFFEDIGLFVQLYHGMDYYNIYFNHQLNIIRFGIMTETLRF
ncbi:MAG TPA: hypothetical protein VMW01_17195 [Williamwhitmania sp.]|nr:hypothetical protein [Williamwhitmania sp.]